MNSKIKVYATPLGVAKALAATLIQQWQQGPFHLALAGGNTPRLLYQILAQTPVPSHVHIWFTDERCVPPDHPESNFGMAWEKWLHQAGLPENQIHRMQGELPPGQAAVAYRQRIHQYLPHGRFHHVLLGMGQDGHTASLFPGQEEALSGRESCIATLSPSGQARLTLGFPILNAAARISLLVTGAEKAQPVADALSQTLIPPLPVQALHQPTWWLDSAAAHDLPPGEAHVPHP